MGSDYAPNMPLMLAPLFRGILGDDDIRVGNKAHVLHPRNAPPRMQ